MILEVAQVPVIDGHQREFEEALLQAATEVLPQATGFVDFTPHGWCLERPAVYLFTIRWLTLADHVDGFRGSALFLRWRELIGPHFDGAPLVEHFAP